MFHLGSAASPADRRLGAAPALATSLLNGAPVRLSLIIVVLDRCDRGLLLDQ